MVELVPLRQKHIHQMVGATSPYPFVGLAGVEGDAVLGCGGLVYQDGQWIAGLQLAEGGERHPIALVRAALRVIAAARAQRLGRIVAFCDPDRSRAQAFLERLGFERSGEEIYGQPCWVLEA